MNSLSILVLSSLINLVMCLPRIQVKVEQGALKGVELLTYNNRTIFGFLGVPYAKPPTGDHRFKEPVPISQWIGVFHASTTPQICMQYSHPHYKTKEPIRGSEDCLYLNVYTPELPDIPGGSLSCVIMFHGGGFTFGSGSNFGPEYLLDHDVILITVNYRLGPLGFLSTEDDIVPGNNGLKDQLLAIKWVHKNIASFGGDPNKITIAGFSAGAASVHYHLLSPKSRGLFQRAISMSGTALCPWAQAKSVKEKSKQLAATLGCPTSDSFTMIKCLRRRSAYNIVSSTKQFKPYLYCPSAPFGPVVEPKGPTAFIDELPIDIILSRKANDIPWLVSFTSDEGLYPGAEILSSQEELDNFDLNWDQHLPHLLNFNYTIAKVKHLLASAKIRNRYIKGHLKDNFQPFIKMICDRLYFSPIDKTIKLHAEIYKSPIYVYKFSYIGKTHVSDLWMDASRFQGAGHGDDLGYIMRLVSMPPFVDDTNDEMKDFMTKIWISFINGQNMPSTWPDPRQHFPNLGYLNIKGSTDNLNSAESEPDIGDDNFWRTMGFQENIPSFNIHNEL